MTSEGLLFPFSVSLLRQISQLIRQDRWEMRQEMPEKGRISGPFQVYLLLREQETRAFNTTQGKTVMRMTPEVKDAAGRDMVIYGRASIVRTLTNHCLIGRYQVFVSPVVARERQATLSRHLAPSGAFAGSHPNASFASFRMIFVFA